MPLWYPYESDEELVSNFEPVESPVKYLFFLHPVLVDKYFGKAIFTFQRIVLSQIIDKVHLALSNELSALLLLVFSFSQVVVHCR